MNRNNIWIHIGIAVVLIMMAAVLGQIGRWRESLHDRSDAVQKRVETIKAEQSNANAPEVLVRFKPGISLSQIRSIATANNDSLADEIESVSGLAVIDDLDNADAQTVANQYAAMSDKVAYAEVNYRIKLDDPIQKDLVKDGVYRETTAEMPNDPMFVDQWALHNFGQDGGTKRADIDALEAWTTTKGSDEVVVAVLDSGVDFTHIDLKGNMWTRPANVPAYTDDELGTFNDINGYNGTDKISDPMDDNGHGTHCAGIIGAEGDNGEGITGINQKVKIMPLKFLGRGGMGTTEDAIEAINYAIDRKKNGVNIRIISASWGSTSKSKALEDTIRAAGDAGILFIAAAGNDGSNNDSRPHYPSNYDLPNVISVAALDRNDKLAGFSNFGFKTVHIAAPGKDILSTWLGGAYREASGTSMATPYVSGVAALIVAAEPKITMEKLRERLLSTADKIDMLDGKVATGGRICAANAIAGKVLNHLQH
ncbi:MAG TPA: S8 family serine peptidase [Pyrinomonadaceae bacterium]|nr:S8 family serine peptidase [Pyrinomonadaceae bacterium]